MVDLAVGIGLVDFAVLVVVAAELGTELEIVVRLPVLAGVGVVAALPQFEPAGDFAVVAGSFGLVDLGYYCLEPEHSAVVASPSAEPGAVADAKKS